MVTLNRCDRERYVESTSISHEALWVVWITIPINGI